MTGSPPTSTVISSAPRMRPVISACSGWAPTSAIWTGESPGARSWTCARSVIASRLRKATRISRPSGRSETARRVSLWVSAGLQGVEHGRRPDLLHAEDVRLGRVDHGGQRGDLRVELGLRLRPALEADRQQVLHVPRHHPEGRHARSLSRCRWEGIGPRATIPGADRAGKRRPELLHEMRRTAPGWHRDPRIDERVFVYPRPPRCRTRRPTSSCASPASGSPRATPTGSSAGSPGAPGAIRPSPATGPRSSASPHALEHWLDDAQREQLLRWLGERLPRGLSPVPD